MVYNYTTSKVVFARVQRFIDTNDWVGSGMMYLGDCIQSLGYASRRKNATDTNQIVIANHKGELPCDLEFIEKVVYKECRLPINRDSGMLALVDKVNYTWEKDSVNQDWYDIDPPYIVTSFEEGELELFYRAYEMDEDGFLMIPDLPNYRNALVWYVLQQLLLEGFKLKNTTINHSYAVQMFDMYESKARSEVKRMSRDQRQAFSNMWNSLNLDNVKSTLMH